MVVTTSTSVTPRPCAATHRLGRRSVPLPPAALAATAARSRWTTRSKRRDAGRVAHLLLLWSSCCSAAQSELLSGWSRVVCQDAWTRNLPLHRSRLVAFVLALFTWWVALLLQAENVRCLHDDVATRSTSLAPLTATTRLLEGSSSASPIVEMMMMGPTALTAL